MRCLKHHLFSAALMSLLVFALSFSFVGCSSPSSPAPSPEETSAPAEPTVSTLVVCGDAMSHMPITKDAWNDETQTYDYRPLLKEAKDLAQNADYAVANLETTFAGGPNYSGFPAFNSPDQMADGLKDAGFDLLLTANNHCMDQGFSGLCRTLDVLDQAGVKHVGTSRSQEEADHNLVLADVGGIRVAFLGFTYGTNGIPLSSDAPFSVNLFNRDYKTSCKDLDEDRLSHALSEAKAMNPDLIAVMIHWGVEYQTHQNEYQEKVADFLFSEGADVILGGHSHVLQPMELRDIERDGQKKQGFVCYSLGNFTSTQRDRLTDTTVLLELTLVRDNQTGRTQVSDYTYHPMFMARQEGAHRYVLKDAYRTLQSAPSAAQKAKCEQVIDDIHTILDPDHDAGASPAPSEKDPL